MNTTRNTNQINIPLGDQCSKIAYKWAEKTFKNVIHKEGSPAQNLRGAYANMLQFGENNIAITSDGIGTKIELAERMQIYNTLGFDLAAMIVDDLICLGAKPATLSNILDVDYLEHPIVDSLMQGLTEAANFSNIVISGGEIAELGDRISGYGQRMHFNWCATGLGIFNEKFKLINGHIIQSRDIILSLKSRGFRSNGFRLARNVLEEKIGSNWHNCLFSDNKTFGKLLLEPSLIYAPLIQQLIANNISISGIIHVTGGGIAGNLSRLLKKQKHGARLTDLFKPHEVMSKIQKLGNLSEETVYEHWNMGNGMLLIVPSTSLDRIFSIVDSTDNYTIKNVGNITDSPYIDVHSKGNIPSIIRYPL